MRLQKQLYRHDPDNGVFGDCLRTALACLLDVSPTEVPHFMEGIPERGIDGVTRNMNGWLAARDMVLITINFPGDTPLDDVLFTASHGSGGTPFLLSGTSRTGCNHVVICQDGAIIWDPSLTDAGIIGPQDNGYWLVEWLVKPMPRYVVFPEAAHA